MEALRLQFVAERQTVTSRIDFYRAILKTHHCDKLYESLMKIEHFPSALAEWKKQLEFLPKIETITRIEDARYKEHIPSYYGPFKHKGIIAVPTYTPSGYKSSVYLDEAVMGDFELTTDEILAFMLEGIYYDLASAKTLYTDLKGK